MILLIWMMICMISQKISPEEEFMDPNINYDVLMNKLKIRIMNLEDDIKVIKDPIVKSYAYDDLMKTRKEYFNYLKIDLELQHLVLTHPEIYKGGGDRE